MSMFCNVMLLLLYVHVCVTRTGWKTRPRPKTVILLIKQSINQSKMQIKLTVILVIRTNDIIVGAAHVRAESMRPGIDLPFVSFKY